MSVRVGHIEFLNCFPLYYGLRSRRSGDSPDFRLIPGVPTDLNRMLVAGTIDFGPISSVAYARNHARLVLSGRLSISCRGAVDSIQLVTRAPLEEIRSVALTPKSATSVVLLKTMMRLRFGLDVAYEELRGTPEEALETHDAVLLIGDEGLEAMYFPIAGANRYDLGELWQDWTGLPMVYAVWAAREEYWRQHPDALAAIEQELVRAFEYSTSHEDEMVTAALGQSRFDRPCLSRYFQVLEYGFSEEYRRGLARFYELAHEAGELDEVPALRFLEGSGTASGGAA